MTRVGMDDERSLIIKGIVFTIFANRLKLEILACLSKAGM